jgi:signal transduction histidine kinase
VPAAGLEQLVSRTNQALERLRELTRGVFPTQLGRVGLAPALRSLLARSGRITTLQIEESAERRFPPRVETAVYFSCAEALHAGAGPIRIDLSATGTGLVTRIQGFARDGVDIQAIVDRVEAVGGSLNQVETDLVSISLPVGRTGTAPV